MRMQSRTFVVYFKSYGIAGKSFNKSGKYAQQIPVEIGMNNQVSQLCAGCLCGVYCVFKFSDIGIGNEQEFASVFKCDWNFKTVEIFYTAVFHFKFRNRMDDFVKLNSLHIQVAHFAFGLEVASKIIEERVLDDFITERYASFDSGLGKKFSQGAMDLCALAEHGRTVSIIEKSGKQEKLQNLLNSYILG